MARSRHRTGSRISLSGLGWLVSLSIRSLGRYPRRPSVQLSAQVSRQAPAFSTATTGASTLDTQPHAFSSRSFEPAHPGNEPAGAGSGQEGTEERKNERTKERTAVLRDQLSGTTPRYVSQGSVPLRLRFTKGACSQ